MKLVIYMRRKRKCPRIRGIIGLMFFVLIVFLLISAFIRLDKAVKPVAQMQAEHLAKHMANQVITEEVSRYIAENECTYTDFSAVVYDESGEVASVETLTGNINRIQAELAAIINERLAGTRTSAEIPLGTLSGSALLADKGPRLRVTVKPLGMVQVNLISNFESAGVNRTRHSIYARITADMASSSALFSVNTAVSFDYLITDTIIGGEFSF